MCVENIFFCVIFVVVSKEISNFFWKLCFLIAVSFVSKLKIQVLWQLPPESSVFLYKKYNIHHKLSQKMHKWMQKNSPEWRKLSVLLSA